MDLDNRLSELKMLLFYLWIQENLTPATDKDESQMGSRALSPQNSTMQPVSS